MSKELRICPGVGGRKCGAFLSYLDRNPHPTCTRCRGRVCTKDLTCDICRDWSSAQWEAFAKKRSYAERKRSARPSGSSLPPAPKTSPRAGILRKSRTPRLPLLLPPFLQKDGLRGGGFGMYLVLLPVGLPLLPLDLCPARGVEVLLDARLLCVNVLLSPRLLRGLWRWRRLARSGHLLPVLPLPQLPLPAHLCILCEVMSRESLRSPAPVLVPPVLPDLRLEKHGRIIETVRGRAVLVAGLVARALAPLPVRGQERRGRDSSRSLSSRVRSWRNRSQSFDRYRSRRVCSRSVSRRDRSRSSDHCRSRRDRSRRDRSWSSEHCVRVPLLVALHVCDRFSPLTVLSQGIEVDEPDVSCGRVWGQLRSPRLPLSQKRQLQWLLLLWGVL